MARRKKTANPESVAIETPAKTGTEMVDLSAYLEEIGSRLITGPDVARQAQAISATEHRQLVVFRMGALNYAIEISHIDETVRRPEITRVPGLPGWVLGVCNAHGEIISVVDLAAFLELSPLGRQRAEYMLVTHADDQRIGLVVDDVEIIYTLPAEQIVSPPFKVEPNLVHYLQGSVERGGSFIRLLDCDRLLLGNPMQQFR